MNKWSQLKFWPKITIQTIFFILIFPLLMNIFPLVSDGFSVEVWSPVNVMVGVFVVLLTSTSYRCAYAIQLGVSFSQTRKKTLMGWMCSEFVIMLFSIALVGVVYAYSDNNIGISVFSWAFAGGMIGHSIAACITRKNRRDIVIAVIFFVLAGMMIWGSIIALAVDMEVAKYVKMGVVAVSAVLYIISVLNMVAGNRALEVRI